VEGNHGYLLLVADGGASGEWVLLSYRLPREPSTPRIALWRRLKRLGVAQLGDGLVALPADARTREQLEWAAEAAIEAGGTGGVWLARPGSSAQDRALAGEMAAARAAEYAELSAAATAASALPAPERARVLRRLRAQWREIVRRDFFPPPQREVAAAALRALAAQEVAVVGRSGSAAGDSAVLEPEARS
jgi:hypothetical protein